MLQKERGQPIFFPVNYAPHDNFSWLYSLFLAIDANFRLTRKHVSSEERDPSLSDGWAFFVKNEPYQAHIKANWAAPQPVNTISLVRY
jgi:hypothetical protein